MVMGNSKYPQVVYLYYVLSLLALGACSTEEKATAPTNVSQDSLSLIEMINTREKAMKYKDLNLALAQFDSSATWINSQGYYFEGIGEVAEFHKMLTGNDSLDYYYEAGNPRVRILDSDNAIAYYSWKMYWYRKIEPQDTTNREIGLMTLYARKSNDNWKWVAVTNQHTPWFYENVDPVTID